MNATRFYWMVETPPPPVPREPMRLRRVRARNRYGFTIETRHYSEGEARIRRAECIATGLSVIEE